MNQKVVTKPNTYHHGNLKLALVDAYIELLSETSPEKLSLRKLASYVGVAATAVYNHFTDKDALMIAVRSRCLHHFADYLESNHKDDSCPEKNFIALGKHYFRYSVDHNDYFRIIFLSYKEELKPTEELIEAGMHAEEKLRKTVIELYKHHNIPTTLHTEGIGAFACWAMAHGITSLAALHVNRAACDNGRWPQEMMLNNEQSVNDVFDTIGSILVAGILAKIREHIK